MCGIVGCFIKNDSLRPELGGMLSEMLVTMTDRGPDSAGFAVYGEDSNSLKVTVHGDDSESDFESLQRQFKAEMKVLSNHAVFDLSRDDLSSFRDVVRNDYPRIQIMGFGRSMEIYKEVGLPEEVAARFELSSMSGSHGIGHTRMATESAVTMLGSHPFSTGEDQCLAHNGSLSNHNNVRRSLIRKGMSFETWNDSEVAAAYLSNSLLSGKSLSDSLESMLADVDGFYTFIVGTHNGFGVLRDAIACKPAVMAETDDYVAFGSEYRALAVLPGVERARVWEPEPATVYFWER